jgi:hypothetical protein
MGIGMDYESYFLILLLILLFHERDVELIKYLYFSLVSTFILIQFSFITFLSFLYLYLISPQRSTDRWYNQVIIRVNGAFPSFWPSFIIFFFYSFILFFFSSIFYLSLHLVKRWIMHDCPLRAYDWIWRMKEYEWISWLCRSYLQIQSTGIIKRSSQQVLNKKIESWRTDMLSSFLWLCHGRSVMHYWPSAEHYLMYKGFLFLSHSPCDTAMR